ncbi:MAG: murein biosynthesis integral membrane protein MurJ [Chloroflexi bacterium]|nr:murein biosynthesis integral membrane protein MurJ [Chloroflexota bacterium]
MTARNLARAGAIVSVAYLGSRLLGWLRLVVIANLFGAGSDLDAYFTAFRIPDLIYQLVAAGAVSSALIPVLAGLLHRGQRDHAFRVVSTVINALLIALIVVSVVMAVSAPEIVPILAPGFDVVTTELTIRLTRIMLLSPILLAMGAVISAVLNVENRFAAAALAPLLYNGAIIGCAIVLSPWLGIDALAVGVVVGSFLHVAVQLPALRGRFRYDLVLDLRDPAARQTFLLMGPRAIGLGASQVTFIVNTTLATGLAAGSVVAYNVAFTILQIPIGIIGFPLGVVLLPTMSKALAAGSVTEFGRVVVQALRLVLFVMLFVTVVGLVLRRQTVSLLFDYGNFDAQALALTSDTLAFFLLGTAAHSMNVILARAFYSGQDTRTPVTVAVASVVVNVAISVATVGFLGLPGLALGIALGGWLEATVLAFLLWRRSASLDMGALIMAMGIFGIGALLAGVVAFATVRLTELGLGIDPGKPGLLLQVGLASATAAVTYLLYSRAVRVPELPRALGLIRSALRRG